MLTTYCQHSTSDSLLRQPTYLARKYSSMSTYDPKSSDQFPPLPSPITTTASPSHRSPMNASSDDYPGSTWVSNYSTASPCMRSCIFAGISDSQRCSGRSLGVFAREALVGTWERGRRIYGRCCLDEKVCSPFWKSS